MHKIIFNHNPNVSRTIKIFENGTFSSEKKKTKTFLRPYRVDTGNWTKNFT